jgi:carnitine O-acetyltransferase
MTAFRTRHSNGPSPQQQQQQQQQRQRPLKPWKASMIESKGDYRDEAFLEDYIGGPLYDYQHQMPKLPVPSIQETLERFLPTAAPLAKTDEERMALMEACQAFPEQAKELQQRLLARQGEFKDSSWLQLWWNQVS